MSRIVVARLEEKTADITRLMKKKILIKKKKICAPRKPRKEARTVFQKPRGCLGGKLFSMRMMY